MTVISGGEEEQVAIPELTLKGMSPVTVRMAACVVWTMCNQHGCQAPQKECSHRNHRRDVNYLEHCLESLDLPGTFQDVVSEGT